MTVSSTRIATCPVCCDSTHVGPLGEPLEPLMIIEHAPISCAQLFATKEAAVAAGQCRVEIVQCPGCGHIWNAAHKEGPVSLYNQDYYSSFVSSSQAREYQQTLALELNRYLDLEGKTVVEIGCGDGFFLGSLNELGARAIGFEPSSTFQVAAGQLGIQVFNENFRFDGNGRLDFETDVVVMRHVLEHMESPKEVLALLRNRSFGSPAPEFLFLEVPNAVQLLENNLYFDFYNDHVQYFSHHPLDLMLNSVGWKPMASIGATDEFIRLLCRNNDYSQDTPESYSNRLDPMNREPVKSAALKFRGNFSEWKESLNSIISSQRDADRSIAVWGAGARGVAMLCGLGLDESSIAYVVDSDTNKHGKYLPVINLPVSPVDRLRVESIDCVLVTSYTYFDEILRGLEWFRSSGGRVIRVYPEPELLT